MPMPVPGTDFDPDEHPAVSEDHPLLARVAKLVGASSTQWGFDYAWQNLTPDRLVQVLAGNGTDFVCRYINDPGGKGIDQLEAMALDAAGITVVPVYETTGTDFRGGYSAGLADGQRAAAAMRNFGAPAGSYCWFAIDTDTSDYGSTNDYLKGAKAGTAEYIAQLYGPYGVVEAASAAGLGSRHWQTYAWSRGQLSQHAALYQYQNGVMIGGVSMDRDRTVNAAMTGAAWAAFEGTPHPKPPPHPQPAHPPFPYPAGHYLGLQSADPYCHSGFNVTDRPHIEDWQRQMRARGWQVSVDGIYGTQSGQVCRSFQAEKGLPVDGKVGQDTWTKTWTAPVT